MGRKAKWSGPTEAIRVPAHLVDRLMDLARQLDAGEPVDFVQKTRLSPKAYPPNLITIGRAGAETAYLLPGGTIPGDIREEAERLVDELLGECDRQNLDPEFVYIRLVEAWLKPVDQSA